MLNISTLLAKNQKIVLLLQVYKTFLAWTLQADNSLFTQFMKTVFKMLGTFYCRLNIIILTAVKRMSHDLSFLHLQELQTELAENWIIAHNRNSTAILFRSGSNWGILSNENDGSLFHICQCSWVFALLKWGAVFGGALWSVESNVRS